MMTQGPQLDAFQSAGAVPRLIRGAITYAAGTTGAIGATTLFTVTGDVLVTSVRAKCTTDLTSAGAPTWDCGTTGQATVFFGGMPDVTGWDTGEWADLSNGTYDIGGESGSTVRHVACSANIIQTIAVATITGGVVRWYLSYIPLSGDGKVDLHANLVAF